MFHSVMEHELMGVGIYAHHYARGLRFSDFLGIRDDAKDFPLFLLHLVLVHAKAGFVNLLLGGKGSRAVGGLLLQALGA